MNALHHANIRFVTFTLLMTTLIKPPVKFLMQKQSQAEIV